MQKKTLSSILCALALCSVSFLTYGQAPQDNTVTVTATRTEQLVKNVPTTTYVVTAADIEEHQYKTLQDALWQVPGLQVSTGGWGGTDVSIRGSDSRHVLILLDGKRVPNTFSVEDENQSVLQRYTLDNVKQIEVIEGPASSLYGSEAMGGVINIITKDGSKPTSVLGIQYSKHEGNTTSGLNIHYDYNSGWHNNKSLGISLGRNIQEAAYDKNGEQQGYQGPRTPISLTLGYKITPNDVLKASVNYVQEKTKRHTGMSDPFAPFGVKLREREFHTGTYSLEYKGTHGDTDTTLRAYADHFDYFSEIHFPGDRAPFFLGQYAWEKNSVNSQMYEAQISTALNDQNLLTFGAEYRRSEGTSNIIKSDQPAWNLTYQGITKQAYIQHLNNYSFYLQDEFTSKDGKLVLVPSIRYDGSNKYSGHISPKIGVTVKANDDLRIKANYGTGYTMPRFRALFWNWEHFGPGVYAKRGMPNGLLMIGNPDLKPEINNSFDIAIEKDFDSNRGTFKLIYFHNDIKNYLGDGYLLDSKGNRKTVEVPGGLDELYAVQNVARVKINGFTASVNYKVSDNFDFSAAVTKQKPINVETNSVLPRKGQWVVQAGMSYHNKNGFSLSITGNQQFKFINQASHPGSPKSTSDYNYWSALISQKFGPHQDVEAYIGIDNIFNDYQVDRNIDGRSYRVGMNYHF